ncbi:hypothetical protein [Acinetobacter phage Ab65]|nr:hypothetical protein [Acinetobacter phage Ab31]WMC00527.1 hypothetical protein [Acinetobacter phage Ab59]WMC00630.1 hypothetical protein [Acinetobacter phage Ab65]
MKPEQFIREFGVDKAREVVEWAPEGATHYGLRQYRQWEGRILKTFTEGSWRSTAVFGGNLRFIEDDCLCIQDLKRLVESLDLVESYGGIESCKQSLYMLHELTEDPEPIREAVRDHESIYGGGDD